jgi:CDGSH-type Zn-finger protein
MAKIKIHAVENGPYIVEVDGKTHSALCRCGGSNNKPYCDGTHRKINFLAPKADILNIQ